MSTPTHDLDGAGLHPCRTPSQAKRSTRTATSRPAPSVPVTHLATAPPTTAAAEAPIEDRGPSSQLAVMPWLHICRSTTGHLVWDGAQQPYPACRDPVTRQPMLLG